MMVFSTWITGSRDHFFQEVCQGEKSTNMRNRPSPPETDQGDIHPYYRVDDNPLKIYVEQKPPLSHTIVLISFMPSPRMVELQIIPATKM